MLFSYQRASEDASFLQEKSFLWESIFVDKKVSAVDIVPNLGRFVCFPVLEFFE